MNEKIRLGTAYCRRPKKNYSGLIIDFRYFFEAFLLVLKRRVRNIIFKKMPDKQFIIS